MLLPLAAPKAGAPVHYLSGKLGFLVSSASIGLAVWIVLYAITLRRASFAWKLASLIVMVTLGLFYGLLAIGERNLALKEDARQTVRQVDKALDAGLRGRIEPGAGAGPMARLTAAIGNISLADTNGFMTSSNAAGLPQVAALRGLTPDSPVLDHCGRIDALAPRATALSARYPHYLAAARREGARFVAAGELSQGAVDGLIHGLGAAQEPFHRQWLLVGELAGHAGKLCRILARRQWVSGPGGEVRFTSKSDAAEAQALRDRMKPIEQSLASIQQAASARSEAASKALQAP
jgi:hypothetical protein